MENVVLQHDVLPRMRTKISMTTLKNPFALSPSESASLARRGVAVRKPVAVPPAQLYKPTAEEKREKHKIFMRQWREKRKAT
jgi:hypothetical protein